MTVTWELHGRVAVVIFLTSPLQALEYCYSRLIGLAGLHVKTQTSLLLSFFDYSLDSFVSFQLRIFLLFYQILHSLKTTIKRVQLGLLWLHLKFISVLGFLNLSTLKLKEAILLFCVKNTAVANLLLLFFCFWKYFSKQRASIIVTTAHKKHLTLHNPTD